MAKFTEIIQCVKKTRDYADANVFMRPFEIYRAALYNVYGGSRVTDVPYIIIIIIYGLRAFTSSMWGSLRLAPIIIIYGLRAFTSSMWGSLRLAPIILS